MPSMLEVLREYKHLAAKKKNEGALAPVLETRFNELEALVRAEASRRKSDDLDPAAKPRRTTDDLDPSSARKTDDLAPVPTPVPRNGSMAGPSRASGHRASRARASGSPVRPERDTPISMPIATSASARQPQMRAREQRESWVWAAVALLFSAGLVSALAFGLAVDGGLWSLLEGFSLAGIGAWAVVYPGLMAWRELAARRSSAHLSEPDYRATTPVVEPVVGVIAALGAVLWLMLGGYADEGLPRLLGYLTALAFWLAALGWAASLVVRPIAARYGSERAYQQYLGGGAHALDKKNSKRARRLFELALGEAADIDQELRAISQLGAAYEQEAEELRLRGRPERAEELMRTFRTLAAQRTQPAAPTPSSAPPSARRPTATASTKDLPPSQEPMLLAIGQVVIDRSGLPAQDSPEVRTLADQLASRSRYREALEHLVQARLTVPAAWARPAAQEYIQQGLLRSADTVFDALGEAQIPEFYKAVAVEWSRQEGAPPEPAFRLATKLEGLGELHAAARIACQGVLSGLGTDEARRNLGALAVELCQQLGQDPPAEVLESIGRLVAAGDTYRRAGDDASAQRCYQTIADRLINQPDQRELLIPVLNRMFKLDKFLDERYLAVLVDDILANGTRGAQATRILTTHRARNRDDHRVTIRLFELLVHDGQLEEGLRLLKEMSLSTGSNPASVLQHFETLRRRFPDDLRIEVGQTRALIKAGRIQDAAAHLERVMPRVRDTDTAHEVAELVDAVFKWGHPDPELHNLLAQALHSLGDLDGAVDAFENYVGAGGRDPHAIELASAALGSRLALPTGAPNHEAHLRLARFHLSAGGPQEAIPFLEIARGSPEHRVDADLLLARAEVAASNPRRAVQVLRDAIDGRHPRDTPELHYELARVYDVLGDRKKARQIDHALEEYAPEAVRYYQEKRPLLEKRDTEWMPGLPEFADRHFDTEAADHGTDPGYRAHEMEPTFVDDDEQAMTLEEALAPRYVLSKRLGAGGMGDVHLARDEMLGRPVAIKVLRRTLATDLFISKFRDEARIVAKLSHPGIVGVYDIGQRRDWSYIVMEYVRGPNLSALVNAAAPPSRPDLVRYVAAVADAMSYAHEQGVIHRDLKPANILIGHDGKVKVTDFGIAHVLHADGEETAFSAAGLQVGTVNYMAPEQLQGKAIDRRTDIYLLGTTLYYVLCRRYPYMGEAIAVRKLREPPTPLSHYVPDLSPELEACVQQCIAKEPTERFQRMEELAVALRLVPEARTPPPPLRG